MFSLGMKINKFLIPLSDMFSRGVGWAFIASMPFFIEQEKYGIIVLLYGLEIILGNVFILGQDKYILRYFQNVKVVKDSLVLILIASVLLISTLNLTFEMLIDYDMTISILMIFGISIILGLYNRLYLSKYRVENRNADFSKQRILLITSRFIFFYILVFSSVEVVTSFVVSLMLSYSLVSLIYIKELKEDFTVSKLKCNNIKDAFLFGWPISLHLLSTSLISHADKFIINKFLDSQAVGIYTFSYMLGSGFTFLLAALSIYYEPMIYKYSDNNVKQERIITKFFISGITAASAYFIILLFLQIYINFFEINVNYLSDIVLISLFSHFLNLIYLKSSFRLYSKGKSLNVSLITIMASMVNISMNFVLIPIYGLQGAIFSTLLSSTILALFMAYMSLRNIGKLTNDIIAVITIWFFSFFYL